MLPEWENRSLRCIFIFIPQEKDLLVKYEKLNLSKMSITCELRSFVLKSLRNGNMTMFYLNCLDSTFLVESASLTSPVFLFLAI